MKTTDLEGALLDYWVVRAEGFNDATARRRVMHEGYMPSLHWGQGGLYIRDQRPSFFAFDDEPQRAGVIMAVIGRSPYWTATGPDHLVATLRAIVLKTFGPDVPDVSLRDDR